MLKKGLAQKPWNLKGKQFGTKIFILCLITHLNHVHLTVKKLFQWILKTAALAWRITSFVSKLSKPTNGKEIFQMMRGLKLHFWKNLPKKSSVRDHKVSGGKDSRRNINQGLFEEANKNTFSKFKGSFCQQHLPKTKAGWPVPPNNKPKKVEKFHPLFPFQNWKL